VIGCANRKSIEPKACDRAHRWQVDRAVLRADIDYLHRLCRKFNAITKSYEAGSCDAELDVNSELRTF